MHWCTRAPDAAANIQLHPTLTSGSEWFSYLCSAGESSNGRTADSGSVRGGSTPPSPAIWPHRLTVRTPASHVGSPGSNPGGVTIRRIKSSSPCGELFICPFGRPLDPAQGRQVESNILHFTFKMLCMSPGRPPLYVGLCTLDFSLLSLTGDWSSPTLP